MQHFNWTSFTHKITVRASMDALYHAWATSSGLEQWFLKEAVYSNQKGINTDPAQPAHEGDAYYWNWYAYSETENGRVLAANGKDLFQFTFAGDCTVTIKLSQNDAEVLVTLTQDNIPTDDASKQNIRLGCATGWSFFLVNLKSVLEGGLDLRNKNEALIGMVNN